MEPSKIAHGKAFLGRDGKDRTGPHRSDRGLHGYATIPKCDPVDSVSLKFWLPFNSRANQKLDCTGRGWTTLGLLNSPIPSVWITCLFKRRILFETFLSVDQLSSNARCMGKHWCWACPCRSPGAGSMASTNRKRIWVHIVFLFFIFYPVCCT